MSESKVQDENENSHEEQNPMVQRIALEVKRRDPSSIRELVLDNCARCYSIEGLTEDFCNLRVLSIINVGLQSLAKFPKLPKLRELHLSDNRLTSGLENLQHCPNLSLLVLAGNRFKSIEQLEPLTKLGKLSSLDLMNCEVTKIANYRTSVFNLLPNLKYLDNVDKDNVEQESDDDDEDQTSDEEEEEEESKTGLKALYNGTFEDDEDEESYEQQSDEDDEDDDLSDEEPDADDLQTSKGEKRKRDSEDAEDNESKDQKKDEAESTEQD